MTKTCYILADEEEEVIPYLLEYGIQDFTPEQLKKDLQFGFKIFKVTINVEEVKE